MNNNEQIMDSTHKRPADTPTTHKSKRARIPTIEAWSRYKTYSEGDCIRIQGEAYVNRGNRYKLQSRTSPRWRRLSQKETRDLFGEDQYIAPLGVVASPSASSSSSSSALPRSHAYATYTNLKPSTNVPVLQVEVRRVAKKLEQFYFDQTIDINEKYPVLNQVVKQIKDYSSLQQLMDISQTEYDASRLSRQHTRVLSKTDTTMMFEIIARWLIREECCVNERWT